MQVQWPSVITPSAAIAVPSFDRHRLIAFYPHDGDSGDMLIKHAVAAMYRAKDAGKNTVCLYPAGEANRVDSGPGRALPEQFLEYRDRLSIVKL